MTLPATYRRERMPRALSRDHGEDRELEGLSGWLIPLGMFLISLVIIAAVNFFTTLSPLLDPLVQANPGMMGDGLMAAVIGNTLGYALLFGLSVWAVVLFFMRHIRFPAVMVGVFVVNTLLSIAGVLIMIWLLPGELFSYDVVVVAVISAVLGVLYLKFSRRVKRTFQKGRPWRQTP